MASSQSQDQLNPNSANKPATTRMPPPSLFQGPPSRNTSNTSLPGILLPGAGASAIGSPASTHNGPGVLTRPYLLHNQRSFYGSNRLHPDRDAEPSMLDPNVISKPSPLSREASVRRLNTAETEQDRADALWAEMQSTLAEVELSAVNGTHVFGAEHARALEELRSAQLSLAQAWARSEADEVIESEAQHRELEQRANERKGSSGSTTDRGAGLLNRDSDSKAGLTEAGKKSLEEETEKDILLARRRREANDRYFERVNSGVLDVVGRLEEVAEKMRRVERESRSIWSESGSVSGSGSGSLENGGGRRLRSGTLESKRSQKTQSED